MNPSKLNGYIPLQDRMPALVNFSEEFVNMARAKGFTFDSVKEEVSILAVKWANLSRTNTNGLLPKVYFDIEIKEAKNKKGRLCEISILNPVARNGMHDIEGYSEGMVVSIPESGKPQFKYSKSLSGAGKSSAVCSEASNIIDCAHPKVREQALTLIDMYVTESEMQGVNEVAHIANMIMALDNHTYLNRGYGFLVEGPYFRLSSGTLAETWDNFASEIRATVCL